MVSNVSDLDPWLGNWVAFGEMQFMFLISAIFNQCYILFTPSYRKVHAHSDIDQIATKAEAPFLTPPLRDTRQPLMISCFHSSCNCFHRISGFKNLSWSHWSRIEANCPQGG